MSEPLRPDWIKWVQDQVRIVTDGGVLAFPSTGLVYQIDKTKKVARLVAGDSTIETHEITVRIFQHLGWKVASHENN